MVGLLIPARPLNPSLPGTSQPSLAQAPSNSTKPLRIPSGEFPLTHPKRLYYAHHDLRRIGPARHQHHSNSCRTSSSSIHPSDAKLTICFLPLQIDATSKANSGHPGAPMGMAPVSHVLFNKYAILAVAAIPPTLTEARIGNQVHEVQPQKPQVDQPRQIRPLVSSPFYCHLIGFRCPRPVTQLHALMTELTP